MSRRKPETFAKRARELALQERRARKRARKAEASQRRDVVRNAIAAEAEGTDDAPTHVEP